MLVWDVTCPDTLSPSYSNMASREAGTVAEEAERRKKAKYVHLEESHYLAWGKYSTSSFAALLYLLACTVQIVHQKGKEEKILH